MPNWCYNNVIFKFPTIEKYNDFIIAVNNKILFETFVPLSNNSSENKNEWSINNAVEKWGTKWEPSEVDIELYPLEQLKLELSFDTAWAPPVGFYESINKNHNIFSKSYFYESGEGIFGYSNYEKEYEKIEYYDYPINKFKLSILRANIDQDLDNFMESEWESLIENWDCEENDEIMN